MSRALLVLARAGAMGRASSGSARACVSTRLSSPIAALPRYSLGSGLIGRRLRPSARIRTTRRHEEIAMSEGYSTIATDSHQAEDLDRNLALELVRVTEAAAMAAGRWVGRGDNEGGDGAAVDAMRKLINSVSMRGVVVIGEGEKDNAPMLYNGEQVGDGSGPEVDVAVDPIDGTTLMSSGMPGAIAVLAVAERGAMFDPSAVFYMEKLAVGPDCADVVDLDAGITE